MTKKSIAVTVKSEFEASTADIDAIFTSFRNLHSIYTDSFRRLRDGLTDLPIGYKKQVKNANTVFDNMARSVEEKQKEISSLLYSQATVLLVGNAESVMRSMFDTLVIKNFRKLKVKKGSSISFSLDEILIASSDSELGELLIEKLEGDKNPRERLNFQNMKQVQGILKGYFDIKIEDEYVSGIHEYWQLRHIIVHNQSFPDSNFFSNLKAAGIDDSKYDQDDYVKLSKSDYEKCFEMLLLFFDNIDNEILRNKLVYEY